MTKARFSRREFLQRITGTAGASLVGGSIVLNPQSLFALRGFTAPVSGTVVQFVDVTSEAKINFKHENGASKDKLMVETFGSGVAWIDYDNRSEERRVGK